MYTISLHFLIFYKAPLITLMTGSSVSNTFEICYTVLKNIYYIVQRQFIFFWFILLFRGGNKNFESQYKYFYCKYDEPTYVKHLKLKILAFIASESNLGDILNELGFYCYIISNI